MTRYDISRILFIFELNKANVQKEDLEKMKSMKAVENIPVRRQSDAEQ